MLLTWNSLCLLVIIAAGVFGNLEQRALNKACPPKEDIPKCSCIKKAEGPEIFCNSFDSNDELKTVLGALKDYSVRKLEISRYNATNLPTDIFRGLYVRELIWDKVEVQDVSFRRDLRHFQGLEESLNSLEIRKSFRSGHRPLLNLKLDHLRNLEVVMLDDNDIPEVGDDWFTAGPEKLSFLMFERNNIEELGKSAFASLHNLQILAVAGNHLRSVTRSMFPLLANKLRTLDLAGNKIHDLPTDIFSNMPSLEEVNLENNLILSIAENTWSSIWSQLKSISLKGNPLVCDGSMKWICKEKRHASGQCLSPSEVKGKSLLQFCARY